MSDVGCWMLDVGCWMWDVGCRKSEVGNEIKSAFRNPHSDINKL